MITFKEYLEEAKNLTIAYHSTPHKFKEFRTLSHFGSKKAAQDRYNDLSQNGYYDSEDSIGIGPAKKISKITNYKAHIDLGNTLHLKDEEQLDHMAILGQMKKKGIITPEEHSKIYKNNKSANRTKFATDVAKLIRSKGYHSITYENEFEDPGSKSYIITHPSQIKRLYEK